jgi:hypothetical protein
MPGHYGSDQGTDGYHVPPSATRDTSSGRLICKLFLTLPSRKLYEDYYNVIPHPIALSTIQVRTRVCVLYA